MGRLIMYIGILGGSIGWGHMMGQGSGAVMGGIIGIVIIAFLMGKNS